MSLRILSSIKRKKVYLSQVSEAEYAKLGELFLLFSQLEVLINNAVFLSRIPAEKHKEIVDLDTGKDYFDFVNRLSLGEKLKKLKKLGFDTKKLKEAKDFRDTFAHGLIREDWRGFLQTVSLRKGRKYSFDVDETKRIINILEKEGGKILDFIESKGYSIPGSKPKRA